MVAPGRRRTIPQTSWLVGGAIAVSVLARLPYLDLPAWSDEAGFLTVGGAWKLGGSTGPGGLYGDYWVDRPPLLITLYGMADRLGGLVPLRLLGALAVAVTVAGVAWIAHLSAGGRAAGWAALVMAALLSTPYHWSFMVDGELLAAPAVALGIALVAGGITADGRRGMALSCLGGAAAVAAVLTKQNFADVFVFMAAYVALLALSRSASRSALARHAGAFLAGAVGLAAAAAVWTVAHGTSLSDVLYAMYAFRLDVESVASWRRLAELGVAGTLSGLVVLAIWVAASGVRRGHRDPLVGALLTVLAFDLVSVAAGGNYWLHYLVQPAIPVAALTGILVARGSWIRVAALVLVPLTLAGWLALVLAPPQSAEQQIGRAIGTVAEPGDSLVTVWGRANVGFAARLPSPYPYLWVVPALARDPGAAELKALLASDHAPTWLVTWRRPRNADVQGSLGAVIEMNYRKAARICGREVYVRWDVRRNTPATAHGPRCRSITVAPAPLRTLMR